MSSLDVVKVIGREEDVFQVYLVKGAGEWTNIMQ